jgi:tetratricopeptide (TPR) repeat protein
VSRSGAGVDTLFAEVLEAEDGGAALLDRLAREAPDVHRELLSLLGFHRRAGGFLETGPDLAPLGGPEETLAPGSVLDHYRIHEVLGEGGMGTVYRVHDLALDRTAALKVLRPELAGLDATLLRREARLLARLQHPGIATFLEARRTGDTWYLAMECVSGTTLRHALRAGPLDRDSLSRLAGDMLTALGHAHAAGILHLDLKPSNLMGTPEGRWKLLDFGISRAVGEADPGEELVRGAGTPGFRAPEQERGEPDERTDVFGAAAVLRAALAGTGDAAPPDDPTGKRLHGLLEEALDPDPARRPSGAAAFLARWEEILAHDTPGVVESLALLPAPGSTGWGVTGLREAVRERLAGVAGLRLVPEERLARARASADLPPAELGRRLGCSLVAYAEPAGDGEPALDLRVLRTATGESPLQERVAGGAEQADELAADIVRLLTRGILHTEIDASHGTRVRVLAEYARGMQAHQSGTRDGMEEARRRLEAVLEADPDHVPSLVLLSSIYGLRYPGSTDPADLREALAYARRALAVAPGAADAHVWLSYALLRAGEPGPGLEAARRATTLAPDSPAGPYFAGAHLHAQGRSKEAGAAFAEAVRRDASWGWSFLGLGWAHLEEGRLTESIWAFEQALDMERSDVAVPTVGAGAFLAEALRRAGRLDEAWTTAREALDALEASDSFYRDTFRALTLRNLGWIARDRDDAEAARTAFRQAVAHLDGRPRTLAGGGIVVQAWAGLAALEGNRERLDEAERLLRDKDRYDFSWLWSCTDDVSRGEIVRAGRVLRPARDTI